MSRSQLGGYEFNYELTRIRNAVTAISDDLAKILNNNPGPQTIIALVGHMAVQLPIILDAVHKLEQIGKQTKNDRTKE
jgi:hypothetical protein